jgi:predicted RNase H-like HicB family nuclease
MTDATMGTRIVRVEREQGKAGLFYATSPDLKGFLAAGKTREALEKAIPQAIKDLYAAHDMEVIVSPVDEPPEDKEMWVAFPAEIARRVLNAPT